MDAEAIERVFAIIAVVLFYVFPYLRETLKKRRVRRQQRQKTNTANKKRPRRSADVDRPRSDQVLADRSGTEDTATEGSSPTQDPPQRRNPMLGGFAKQMRNRAEALKRDATHLFKQSAHDPRTKIIATVLSEELIKPTEDAIKTLSGAPPMATLVQEGERLRGLQTLLAYSQLMVEQRLTENAAYLGEADQLARSCYIPFLEFANAHQLPLKTMHPVTVHGDWDLSIVLELAASSLAPLRVPNGFGRSLWLWPAVAHEIAHDIYFGVQGLPERLHTRLDLSDSLQRPRSARAVDETYLRELLGPWLDEIFADILCTMMLGPASVHTMRRAFASPDAPPQAAVIHASDDGAIARHPPATFRVHVACKVLHFLGQHQAADDHWEAWTKDHPNEGLLFLPMAKKWIGFPQEALFEEAEPILRSLIEDPWPEFAQYHLVDIPGLTYLHAEHAKVERAKASLLASRPADADPRFVIAAAVWAATERPGAHDQILRTAFASILSAGEARPDVWDAQPAPAPSAQKDATLRAHLRRALRSRRGLRDAVAFGAALNRPDPRRR